jgi:hypothetical protein
MIENLQWVWLVGSLICGLYAIVADARRRGHAYIRVKHELRVHVFVSAFLFVWFMTLLVLSVVA